VHPKLRGLVAKCLEKDPTDRFGSARDLLAALDAGQGARRPSLPRVSWRALVATGAVVVALFLAALLGSARRRSEIPAAAPPSGTVAILPFGARDAPRFAWLSEGVVDLVARDLEGSELRAVDSASVLRAVGGDSTADIDKVRGASAQLGAKYFVLGRIEERRGQLVLEAFLHTGDAGLPVAAALAQGDPTDLLRLVRKLSDQLRLRPLSPQEFEARLASLARRTSRSPQALQSWLEGEQLQRRGHWDEVVGHFQRAVAADPQFALAQYRLGMIARVAEPGLAEDALQRALLNSDRLSPSEQVLLTGRLARQQGRFADAESAFQEATRKYPDDSKAWMELAELYFHENPLRARPSQESSDALQHVLVLDPLNTEAMAHLGELALLRGERALAGKLADRLIALVDDPRTIVINRLTTAWARGDEAENEKVMGDLFKPATSRALFVDAFARAEWLEKFADAERIAARTAESDVPEERSWGFYLRGLVDLAGGRPQAGRAGMIRAAQLDPSGNASYRVVWIDALDFVPSSAAQVATARAAAERIDFSRSVHLLPQKEFIKGLLALRAGDMTAAEGSAEALEQMPPIEGSSITADLALAIRARLLAARHHVAGALQLLEKQRLRIPGRYVVSYPDVSQAQLRASLLAAAGRAREALEVYDALNIYSAVHPVYLAPAHLAKARVLDQAGDQEGAIKQYVAFIKLWHDCEPAERAEVDVAAARLAALRHEGERASR
jgi:tetratricopeptide (TPR) repeat protein